MSLRGENRRGDPRNRIKFRRINMNKKVILLNSECIGQGDETLGFEILMTLLNSLQKRNDKPEAIILWNTAVRLMTAESPASGPLRELELAGVKILGGMLCLKDLCIVDAVIVGKAVTMDDILDLLLHNEVISL
jgi:hypothetical protein